MTDNKKQELKPCPFCGSRTLSFKRCGLDDECSFVHCENCEAGGPTCTPRSDKNSLDEWNTRALSSVESVSVDAAMVALGLSHNDGDHHVLTELARIYPNGLRITPPKKEASDE